MYETSTLDVRKEKIEEKSAMIYLSVAICIVWSGRIGQIKPQSWQLCGEIKRAGTLGTLCKVSKQIPPTFGIRSLFTYLTRHLISGYQIQVT